MKTAPSKITPIVSWIIILWTSLVFLGSLPYKFSDHPDTQHIFGTIGSWLEGALGPAIGQGFSQFGGYVIGAFELVISLVLLLPAVAFGLHKAKILKSPLNRAKFHYIGGLMASAVMGGAIFFHIFSPLGIEVLHQGQSDGGSLFKSAVSIFVGGIILFLINRKNA